MSDDLRFIASLYRLNSDREGAVRLTLDVPESELANVVQLLKWREMALEIVVKKYVADI